MLCLERKLWVGLWLRWGERRGFFFDHTAFKLYSLWHVGYLHDNLYGF
jgi:hypothetical protein